MMTLIWLAVGLVAVVMTGGVILLWLVIRALERADRERAGES